MELDALEDEVVIVGLAPRAASARGGTSTSPRPPRTRACQCDRARGCRRIGLIGRSSRRCSGRSTRLLRPGLRDAKHSWTHGYRGARQGKAESRFCGSKDFLESCSKHSRWCLAAGADWKVPEPGVYKAQFFETCLLDAFHRGEVAEWSIAPPC